MALSGSKPSEQAYGGGSANALPCKRQQKSGSPKKGGRPVTWVGGGGLSYQSVANKGVPELRALFLEIFGHPTASNNSTWLRKKLCDPPDETYGRGRNLKVRKRDHGAAIWTSSATSKKAHQLSGGKSAGKTNGLQPIRIGSNTSVSMEPVYDSPASGISMSFSLTKEDALTPRVSEAGSSFSTETAREQPRKRSSAAACTMMAQLKHLASTSLGAAGPPTVEVFWPEEAGGGSWWPAKVLKVLPRKGICTVLYCTEEQENLDLHEILEAEHLRLVPGHVNHMHKRQRIASDTGSNRTLSYEPEADAPQSHSASSLPGVGDNANFRDEVKMECDFKECDEEAEEQVLRDLQSFLANPVGQECPADMAQLHDGSNSSQDSGQWPEELALSSDMKRSASEPMVFEGLENSSSFTATSDALTETNLPQGQESEFMGTYSMATNLSGVTEAVFADAAVQTPPLADPVMPAAEGAAYSAASIELQMANVQAAIDMKLAAIKNQQIAQQLQYQMLGIPFAYANLAGDGLSRETSWLAGTGAVDFQTPSQAIAGELPILYSGASTDQGGPSAFGLQAPMFDVPLPSATLSYR